MARWNWPLLLVLSVFLAVYVLISFVNHWFFRTYALDLGLYTNAAWKYAHGIVADRSLFTWNHDPLLTDHFDLHLILWSPLTYLFGEWTLLVVQVAAALWGGVGMYRLAMALTTDRTTSMFLMACCLGSFGMIQAFGFDFHSNVVAAMALPWYFLALFRRRKGLAWTWLFFMLVARENMGLWLGVTAFASIGINWMDSRMRRTLLLQGGTALVWSAVVIVWVMPAMDGNKMNFQTLRYAHLGPDWAGIVKNFLRHPMHVLQYFVVPVEDEEHLGNALKLEYYVALLASGAWALLFRWPYLLMALSLLAQKMLSSSDAMSGLFYQYSVEFAGLLPIAMLDVLQRVRSWPWRHVLAFLGFGAVVGTTIYTLDLPLEHWSNAHGAHDRLRFYQARHYRSKLDVAGVHRVLKRIPAGASISAVSGLVPHLAGRDRLYAFPIMHDDPEYLVFLKDEVPWPLTSAEFGQALDHYRSSPEWRLAVDSAGVLVFQRMP
ncbi:MAG: DUF2079 domain-containing protein [Bacteroidetes bacterium]|nr:DUF2079 domain-containing protein [Bacteroidota bacterium]MBS1940371.1 DUF2079 domain-containing protein [Bacteroidota bacterium]